METWKLMKNNQWKTIEIVENKGNTWSSINENQWQAIKIIASQWKTTNNNGNWHNVRIKETIFFLPRLTGWRHDDTGRWMMTGSTGQVGWWRDDGRMMWADGGWEAPMDDDRTCWLRRMVTGWWQDDAGRGKDDAGLWLHEQDDTRMMHHRSRQHTIEEGFI